MPRDPFAYLADAPPPPSPAADPFAALANAPTPEEFAAQGARPAPLPAFTSRGLRPLPPERPRLGDDMEPGLARTLVRATSAPAGDFADKVIGFAPRAAALIGRGFGADLVDAPASAAVSPSVVAAYARLHRTTPEMAQTFLEGQGLTVTDGVDGDYQSAQDRGQAIAQAIPFPRDPRALQAIADQSQRRLGQADATRLERDRIAAVPAALRGVTTGGRAAADDLKTAALYIGQLFGGDDTRAVLEHQVADANAAQEAGGEQLGAGNRLASAVTRNLLPMTITAPLGGAAALPGAGAIIQAMGTQGGQAYQDAIEAGLSDDDARQYAAKQAIEEGAPAGASAALGVGGLEAAASRGFATGAGRARRAFEAVKGLGKHLGGNLIEETPEELLTTFLQQRTEDAIHPGAADDEQMARALSETVKQTAALTGSTSVQHLASTALEARQARLRQAAADAFASAGQQTAPASAAAPVEQAPVAPPAAPAPAPAAPVFAGGPQGGGAVEQPGGMTPEDAAAAIAALFGQAPPAGRAAAHEEVPQAEMAGIRQGAADKATAPTSPEQLAQAAVARLPLLRGYTQHEGPVEFTGGEDGGLPAVLHLGAVAKGAPEAVQPMQAVAAATWTDEQRQAYRRNVRLVAMGLRANGAAQDGTFPLDRLLPFQDRLLAPLSRSQAQRLADEAAGKVPAAADSAQAAQPSPAPAPAPAPAAPPAAPAAAPRPAAAGADAAPDLEAPPADRALGELSPMEKRRRFKAEALATGQAEQAQAAAARAPSSEPAPAAAAPAAHKPGDLVDISAGKKGLRRAEVLSVAPDGRLAVRFADDGKTVAKVPPGRAMPAQAQEAPPAAAPPAAPPVAAAVQNAAPASPSQQDHFRAFVADLTPEERASVAADLKAVGETPADPFSAMQGIRQSLEMAKAVAERKAKRAAVRAAPSPEEPARATPPPEPAPPSQEAAPSAPAAPAAVPEPTPGAREVPAAPAAARRTVGSRGSDAEGIADFGQKLGGARKDRLSLEDFDRLTPEEQQTEVTKDKVLPAFDPAERIAAGMPAPVAHLVHQIRSAIATKPILTREEVADPAKRSAAIREYVDQVARLGSELSQAKSMEDVTRIYKGQFPGLFNQTMYGSIVDKAGESPEVASKRYHRLASTNALHKAFLASHANKRRAVAEVAKGWPAAARWTTRYDVGSYPQLAADGTLKDRFTVRAKNAEQRRQESGLQREFETREAAEAEAAKRYEGLTKAGGGAQPITRPLKADLERIGSDRREGKDVTPEDFAAAFGFRGTEFGNWTNQADRQQSLNQAFDGLHDLADLMGVPARALSLDGKLGLAFGARGGGKFAAHYEPGKVVINLTRTKGAGALAHEWAHAVDNYFGKMGSAGLADSWSSHAVDLKRAARDAAGKAGVRPEIADAWAAIHEAMHLQPVTSAEAGKRRPSTQYLRTSQGADKNPAKPYWGREDEMFARAFETWAHQRLQDAGKASPYLVQGVPSSTTTPEEVQATPWLQRYPQGAEAERINAAIDGWAKALKSEETEGGNVRLFGPERTPGEEGATAPAAGETLAAQERTPGDTREPRAKRPTPDQGIESSIAWALADREQTISQMRTRAERAKDPAMKAEYERIANDYAAVDPDEMAEHMRAFPAHYMGSTSGRGGNMHPVAIYRQRADLPPVEARVAPAKVPPGDVAPDLRSTLKELVASLKKASKSAPVLDVDRGALPQGSAGEFDPRTQAVTMRYHNDLDLVAHEVGHWAGETFGLLPAKDDTVARAELARFGVHGTPAKGELRQREGMAEYFRAWMVNPGEAQTRAPTFTAQMREKVPGKVLDALEAYGLGVRRFEGATSAQQIAAGIMPTKTAARDEKAKTRISRLIVDGVAGLFGAGKRKPQMRGGLVPKGFNATRGDKVSFAFNDHQAPQLANYLTSLAMTGQDPATVKPSQHWDFLRKGLRGQAGYLRDMVLEHGLRNPDLSVATDDDGTPMTLGWLLDPVVQLGDRWQTVLDKAHAYGVAQRSAELEQRFTRQVEDEIQTFAAGKLDAAGDNRYQRDRAEEEVAAFAKEQRAALRRRLARLTAAGGGLHNATETAKKALDEMQADPDREAVQDYLRRYRLWANWNLSYAVASDLLSPDQAANIQGANQYYIDWHRVFGEDDGPIDVGQAVEGSSRTIHNPLASLLHATWSAVSRGDANRAMLTFTAPLRGKPVQGQDGSLAQLGRKLSAEQAQDAFTKQNGYHDDATGDRQRVYRIRRLVARMNDDGSPVFDPRTGAPLQEVETENWVFHSGTEASIEAGRALASDHPWLLLMQGLNGLQRNMITLAPGFRLKVPIRDNIERLLNSEVGSGVGDIGKILRHQVQLDGRNLDELFTFSGANMAGYNQKGREQALAEVFDHVEGLRKKGYSILTPKGFWHAWQRFGEEAENVARKAEFAAAYRKARAEGMSQLDASLSAMTHARGLLDTAEHGYLVGRINGIALFFNAQIKGLMRNLKMARAAISAYRRGDTAVGNRLSATLSLRMMAWGGALMAFRFLKLGWGDEDEQKNELAEPGWKRDFAITFEVPGLGKVAIPKPYEWGWLGSGFERMADYTWAKAKGWDDHAARAYEGYGKSFLGAVMPIEPDIMGGSFMPALEVLGNFDTFTQGHIVTPFEEKLDLDLRKGQERASVLGKALGALVHADARNVDHLIRGYFGGFGSMATARTWSELAKRASGYSGETSPYASRDVAWVLEESDSRGLSGKKPFPEFRKLVAKAAAAEGPARAKMLTAVRERAEKLRAALERRKGAAAASE